MAGRDGFSKTLNVAKCKDIENVRALDARYDPRATFFSRQNEKKYTDVWFALDSLSLSLSLSLCVCVCVLSLTREKRDLFSLFCFAGWGKQL